MPVMTPDDQAAERFVVAERPVDPKLAPALPRAMRRPRHIVTDALLYRAAAFGRHNTAEAADADAARRNARHTAAQTVAIAAGATL